MISRLLQKKLEALAQKLPVVAILGPRQSGKTTLSRMVFGNYAYVSLENLDSRTFAQEDPRSFLDTYAKEGVIFDEIQHVPLLLSYIQTWVDEWQKPGQFILTGSQNFLINEAITQTLAGRIAILNLLPLSVDELAAANLLPAQSEECMFLGGYPRIYAKEIAPEDWYPNYIQTYIERDVRQVKNVHDLAVFQRFLKLCAGRIGQLINFSSLANDCDVSLSTVKSWLSLLEQSFIIFLLRPHHANFSKRLVKTPKLYFVDTGLACTLLEIQ